MSGAVNLGLRPCPGLTADAPLEMPRAVGACTAATRQRWRLEPSKPRPATVGLAESARGALTPLHPSQVWRNLSSARRSGSISAVWRTVEHLLAAIVGTGCLSTSTSSWTVEEVPLPFDGSASPGVEAIRRGRLTKPSANGAPAGALSPDHLAARQSFRHRTAHTKAPGSARRRISSRRSARQLYFSSNSYPPEFCEARSHRPAPFGFREQVEQGFQKLWPDQGAATVQ